MQDPKEPKAPKERLKITDRRSFTAQGERRLQDSEREAASPPSGPGQTVRGEGFELRHGEPAAAGEALAAVPFNAFVISLASTAFIHLGEMEDPVTSSRQTNLEGARQMIDIIDMLRQKTHGNLDAAEQELIEGVLFELKLKYTQKASAARS